MILTPGILLYLGLCLLLGYLGRVKKFGFTGNFLGSLLLTPVLGFVFYLLQSDAGAAKPADAVAAKKS